jgi:hypothetical protein
MLFLPTPPADSRGKPGEPPWTTGILRTTVCEALVCVNNVKNYEAFSILA